MCPRAIHVHDDESLALGTVVLVVLLVLALTLVAYLVWYVPLKKVRKDRTVYRRCERAVWEGNGGIYLEHISNTEGLYWNIGKYSRCGRN